MKKILLIIFLLLSFESQASTYDQLLSSKKCKEAYDQNISCIYKAGKSLIIEITGVGTSVAGIIFSKSDLNGDYYGSYGVSHGCVIAQNSNELLDIAFISPKNAKIYKTWKECMNGN